MRSILAGLAAIMLIAAFVHAAPKPCHPAWKCQPAPTWTPLPVTLPPTVSPTAAPRPTATPTATPAIQRVDPPVTSGTVTVPSSIDATGATDVSTALNAFIAGTPNGRIIAFPAGATYKLSQAIRLTGRTDLRFEGNGATLIASDTATASPRNSQFLIESGSNRIYIGNFHGIGGSPAANVGTGNALDPVLQNSEFVATYDAHNIELDHITTERTWGDGIFLGAGNGGAASGAPSSRVWWHDSTVLSAGRNGGAIEYADQVWVERVSFTNIALHVLDIEPEYVGHGGTHVWFTDNPVGTYGWTSHNISYLFAANGISGSVTTDVYVERNTVVGNAAGYNGAPLGLNTTVRGPSRSNIFVRDNSAQRTLAGPVMYFTSVDGVTVTGNAQPLSGGSLASFTSCTNVVSSPNP